MGMFLQMGGIAESKEAVSAVLKNSQQGDAEVRVHSVVEDRVLLIFDGYAQDTEQILAEVSRQLSCPAVWLHVHDDDLWMYQFFQSGVQIDQFNTMPGYWHAIDDEERASWAGDAGKIAEIWPNLKAQDISDYLVDHESPEFDGEQEAYETDETQAWDCWQIVDFMQKLGLDYPADG